MMQRIVYCMRIFKSGSKNTNIVRGFIIFSSLFFDKKNCFVILQFVKRLFLLFQNLLLEAMGWDRCKKRIFEGCCFGKLFFDCVVLVVLRYFLVVFRPTFCAFLFFL